MGINNNFYQPWILRICFWMKSLYFQNYIAFICCASTSSDTRTSFNPPDQSFSSSEFPSSWRLWDITSTVSSITSHLPQCTLALCSAFSSIFTGTVTIPVSWEPYSTCQKGAIYNPRHVKPQTSQTPDTSNPRHVKPQTRQTPETSNLRHIKP